MSETLSEQEDQSMNMPPNEYASLGQPEQNEAGEVLEHHVPDALVLDYDRMLGDVDAAMARLYAAAEACGVETQQIKDAQKQVEADGGSFDPLSFVKNSLGEAAYAEFRDRFIHDDGPDLLYDDARDFLARLQERDVPHVILTYGANAEWQELKLEASGYQAGRMIMPHSDKGVAMDPLLGEDGKFAFGTPDGEVYLTDNLTLIDDKAKSFASLPEHSNGFLLQRGELLPSQQGEVAERVQRITSLRELQIDESGMLVYQPGEEAEPAKSEGGPHKLYLPLDSQREVHAEWTLPEAA